MPKPRQGKDLQPQSHGAKWDGGVVLKGVSLGEGVRTQLSNPKRGLPKRGISGSGASSNVVVEGGKIFAMPEVPAGQEFNIVVEY